MDNSEETPFGRLERLATVEFALVYSRQTCESGFVDVLELELAPSMDDNSGRKEMAQANLDLVDHQSLNARLCYVPLGAVPKGEYEEYFFKVHEGGLYACKMTDALSVVTAIGQRQDNLLNYPLSQCVNVSIAGLDYFVPVNVKPLGHLNVVEQADVGSAASQYNSRELAGNTSQVAEDLQQSIGLGR